MTRQTLPQTRGQTILNFIFWAALRTWVYTSCWGGGGLGPEPAAYGNSQARDRIGATAAGLHTPEPQQLRIQAVSATYTTVHSNTGSPTH